MCPQDKLEAELDAAGLLVTPERPQPRALQYADLSKLTFLCACLKESMRLHPTIPMWSRWDDMESQEREHACCSQTRNLHMWQLYSCHCYTAPEDRPDRAPVFGRGTVSRLRSTHHRQHAYAACCSAHRACMGLLGGRHAPLLDLGHGSSASTHVLGLQRYVLCCGCLMFCEMGLACLRAQQQALPASLGWGAACGFCLSCSLAGRRGGTSRTQSADAGAFSMLEPGCNV